MALVALRTGLDRFLAFPPQAGAETRCTTGPTSRRLLHPGPDRTMPLSGDRCAPPGRRPCFRRGRRAVVALCFSMRLPWGVHARQRGWEFPAYIDIWCFPKPARASIL